MCCCRCHSSSIPLLHRLESRTGLHQSSPARIKLTTSSVCCCRYQAQGYLWRRIRRVRRLWRQRGQLLGAPCWMTSWTTAARVTNTRSSKGAHDNCATQQTPNNVRLLQLLPLRSPYVGLLELVDATVPRMLSLVCMYVGMLVLLTTCFSAATAPPHAASLLEPVNAAAIVPPHAVCLTVEHLLLHFICNHIWCPFPLRLSRIVETCQDCQLKCGL